MIRRARFGDIPRLVDLLQEMHAGSKYLGRVEVDEKIAKALLMAMIQKHGVNGGRHDGGTLFNVVEDRTGEVIGFMVGLLDRVYHIGTMLAAKDVFLYVRQGRAGTLDAGRLIDAYVEWASGNPKVLEINLSWTDTMPDAQRVERLYEAKGFTRCGGIFERSAR